MSYSKVMNYIKNSSEMGFKFLDLVQQSQRLAGKVVLLQE